MKRIRFVSGNKHKIAEVEGILTPAGVEVVPAPMKIEELQTDNVERLVTDKLIKAFKKVGRPVFVEHTGLHLEGLSGLPAGLTEVFWERLKAEKFAQLVGGLETASVLAKTVLGFCDGKKLYFFEGEITGTVPQTPAGNRDFQWDCVFIPTGETRTFAELGTERKNEISMRRKALDKFAAFLRKLD